MRSAGASSASTAALRWRAATITSSASSESSSARPKRACTSDLRVERDLRPNRVGDALVHERVRVARVEEDAARFGGGSAPDDAAVECVQDRLGDLVRGPAGRPRQIVDRERLTQTRGRLEHVGAVELTQHRRRDVLLGRRRDRARASWPRATSNSRADRDASARRARRHAGGTGRRPTDSRRPAAR